MGSTPPKVYIPTTVVIALLAVLTSAVVNAEFVVVHKNILYVKTQPQNTRNKKLVRNQGSFQWGYFEIAEMSPAKKHITVITGIQFILFM